MASIKTRYISAATKAEPIRVKLDTAHSETQAAQTRYESTLSSFSSPQEAEQLIEMVISTPHDELQMDGPTYTQSVQAAGVLQEFMAASSQEAELADMANEIEEAMRQAQSDMIAQAEASVNDIIVGTKDAEALKCSFELMLSDKNKMDTSKIIDAAEHFDTKEYPRFASELKAEVEAAVAEVQEATLAADTIRQRQASSNLESVIKRRKAQVISSLNERASKFPSMMQELEMEEMRLEESLRAATDLGKRRSNTYAAAGSPFPD